MKRESRGHFTGFQWRSAKRLLAPEQVEFGLRTRAQAWVFFASLALTSLSLVYFAGKAASAETLASFGGVAWLERAITLDPSNPLPDYQLGALHLFSLERPDSIAAVHHLRRAAELSPNTGPYWLALAAASENAGDARAAQNSIQRALERRPMSPDYWWRAANYDLRTGQFETAWNRFRRLLELSPGHAGLVFRICYKASGDSRVVAKKVLPPDASPALRIAYIDFLRRQGDDEGAFHVWHEMASESRQQRVTFQMSQPYLDALIADNRVDEAVAVWNSLLNSRAIRRPAGAKSRDVVFNGDFEDAPLNGGFDWHAPEMPYVLTDLQASVSYRGAKSASVDFTVKENAEYEILYQFVPVEPRCAYRLRAFVRSESITSDSGPRLRVVDSASPTRLEAATDPVVGTTDWHPVEMAFSTGPDTRLVRLSVWRARSREFPTEISGRFWIDAVSMIPLGPQGELALTRKAALP
ncbi:MAG: hypothetical protein HY508_10600 [Acidobacteria bacterium]|nr:hypothetical protein [Acidobacteriota bacterium]